MVKIHEQLRVVNCQGGLLHGGVCYAKTLTAAGPCEEPLHMHHPHMQNTSMCQHIAYAQNACKCSVPKRMLMLVTRTACWIFIVDSISMGTPSPPSASWHKASASHGYRLQVSLEAYLINSAAPCPNLVKP
eukprot:709442-Pelagomonas_calceolata.AAC.3